jgi:hypothetical protein
MRRRYPLAERRAFVALYHKSSLTQADFAREHRLNLGTFRQWLYRAGKASAASQPVFEEVPLPERWLGVGPAIEIGVGSEITIRLGSATSPEFLGQLVRHLRPPC